MAKPTKRPPTPPAPGRSPLFKGYKSFLARLEPRHLDALRAEAMRRATERGTMRPDASELIREAIDAWLLSKR